MILNDKEFTKLINKIDNILGHIRYELLWDNYNRKITKKVLKNIILSIDDINKLIKPLKRLIK